MRSVLLILVLLWPRFGGAATAFPPQPFTQAQLIAELTRDLAAHFKTDGALQIELARPWTAPTAQASVWSFQILEFPVALTPVMLVRGQLIADGAPLPETTLIVRATLWREAWAARQPLAVGSGFDPAVLERRRVDALRERDVLPTTAGDAGFIITRPVGVGRLLTWRDLGRRPLVRKGDIVEVSAVSGPLLVTLKALALENGAQGETVSLRNPESQKNFSAIVIDESRVQIRL